MPTVTGPDRTNPTGSLVTVISTRTSHVVHSNQLPGNGEPLSLSLIALHTSLLGGTVG